MPDDISEVVARRRQELQARRERLAYDVLVAAETQAADLPKQIELTEGFLRDYAERSRWTTFVVGGIPI